MKGLWKNAISSPSFFQKHFQRSKIFLHHPQPPVATTNRHCSLLKPHTERDPSTEAESSNLPCGFGRERSPNLTFHFPSRLAWNRRAGTIKKSPSDVMRNPRVAHNRMTAARCKE
ncbi:hypothetical protein HKD37_09G024618 [Glycine soja]